MQRNESTLLSVSVKSLIIGRLRHFYLPFVVAHHGRIFCLVAYIDWQSDAQEDANSYENAAADEKSLKFVHNVSILFIII